MELIPTDILNLIFNLLSYYDQYVCKSVCKRFNQLLKHIHLVKFQTELEQNQLRQYFSLINRISRVRHFTAFSLLICYGNQTYHPVIFDPYHQVIINDKPGSYFYPIKFSPQVMEDLIEHKVNKSDVLPYMKPNYMKSLMSIPGKIIISPLQPLKHINFLNPTLTKYKCYSGDITEFMLKKLGFGYLVAVFYYL